MKFLVAAIALFTLSQVAQAANSPPDLHQVAQDVARIKQEALPEGAELAGAYRSDYDEKTHNVVITLKTGDDYLTAVAQSYIFTDLNKDGAVDLAIAIEAPPTTDKTGYMMFGDRSLQIYTAHGAAASLVSLTEGGKVILNADDGGAFGDPFAGLTLNQSGSIQVNHYGGDADRWADVQTFQYRSGYIYLVGNTSTAYNDHTLKGQTIDTDLLTGDQIITTMNGDKKDTVKHIKIAVKPLV